MIKVLHLSSIDNLGGAARASYRIHEALGASGVASEMLTGSRVTMDPRVHVRREREPKKALKYLRAAYRRLVKLQQSTNPVIRSMNVFPFFYEDLNAQIESIDPDIVHLHWVGLDFLSLWEIAKINRPVVWTLHDQWAISGAEHYDHVPPLGRYKRGYLCSTRGEDDRGLDIDRLVFMCKRILWRDFRPTFTAPSRWLAECIKESLLFDRCDTVVIPNPLDTTVFRPVAGARQLLGLADKVTYIVFGALHALVDRRKGFAELVGALQVLKQSCHDRKLGILVFGADRPKKGDPLPIDATWLGQINDDRKLAAIYSAADVMIVPSLVENLPQTGAESIACGTPVVSFDTGGLSDIVVNGMTGYRARCYDTENLGLKIRQAIEELSKRDTDRARICATFAQERLSYATVAAQFRDLYRTCLSDARAARARVSEQEPRFETLS